MKTFRFRIEDGSGLPDVCRIELPDVASARIEAARHFGEIIREHAHHLSSPCEWQLRVTDALGRDVYAIRALARPYAIAGETETDQADRCAAAAIAGETGAAA